MKIRKSSATEPIDEKRMRRIAAVGAISGNFVFPGALMSSEGLVDTDRSLAVSPISGCIYINDKSRYGGGTVKREQFETTKNTVENYLRKRLEGSVGNRATICTNPQTRNNMAAIPDMIVHVEGIEFYNVDDQKLNDTECPRATHSPEGFVIVPENTLKNIDTSSSTITPVQLCQILTQVN